MPLATATIEIDGQAIDVSLNVDGWVSSDYRYTETINSIASPRIFSDSADPIADAISLLERHFHVTVTRLG